ncbi:hypothetical protein ABTX60_10730 [Streptomyces sp. NPDC126510]|uniref:hypothetical protein n=1 Tax=Streptomyces sp. NPDC126510 TaxID=3155317 RepID=UPI00331C3571
MPAAPASTASKDSGGFGIQRSRSASKVPDRLLDKDTGHLKDAKEELKRGLGLPVFRESGGPEVVREALEHRHIPSSRGSNRS